MRRDSPMSIERIKIPHEFPRKSFLRSYNYDADLQLFRLKACTQEAPPCVFKKLMKIGDSE